MAAYYLDTSALVKRYVLEQSTIWVGNFTSPAATHNLYTIRLTGPEIIAALFRKARIGQISVAESIRAAGNFRTDWQQYYQVIELSVSVADQAMTLIERYGLRGYDAVHLTAALEMNARRQIRRLRPLTFVSADTEQIRVAQAEGLLIEDPNRYQ